MVPHAVGLAPHQLAVPARLQGVVPVPGQRGDHVEAVAERGQLVDDAGHDLAGGGHVGREVGAQHDDVHGPDSPRPRPGRRPRPAPAPSASQRELAGPRVAQLDPGARRWSGSSSRRGHGRRPTPRRRRGRRSTPPSPTTSGSAVAVDAMHRAVAGSWLRGLGCRTPHRTTGTLVPPRPRSGRRDRRRGMRPRRRTRVPTPRALDLGPQRGLSPGPSPPVSTSSGSGSVDGQLGEGPHQGEVVLVRGR